MMMQGDLQAMDRLIKLNGELDRITASDASSMPPTEVAPPRLDAPPRALLAASLAADGGKGKLSSPQSLEKSRNQKILGSSCSRD
jgi:hypothetical protein